MEEEKKENETKGAGHKSWLFFSKKAAVNVNTVAYTILILIALGVIITILVLAHFGLLPNIG